MSEAVVTLSSVHKSVREGQSERKILRGVDLSVAAGETLCVFGRSGAGKSTLLHLIAGLDRCDRGEITVCGEDLSRLDEAGRTRLRQRRIGFVFQAFHLLPTLTMAENIALPLELFGTALGAARARARELLDRVGLADRADAFPAVLSGGEQQRAAVARALATAPAIVLADEPTGNLDCESAAAVLDLLTELPRAGGSALVLVSHAAEAAQRCDRVVELVDGRFAS